MIMTKVIKEFPLPVRSHWNFRDELSIVNVIIVNGTRIIIPTKYRPELLSLIHDDSHLGIDTCVLRSKSTVQWPGITEHTKSIVNKCEKCSANCRRNQKEPYIPVDIPIIAWKIVASDLFVFEDKTYVLVTNLFSRFPVDRQLAGESTKTVLKVMKNIFFRFWYTRDHHN